MKKTTFELVSAMNVAFNNPKGDPLNIEWSSVRNQSCNIFDEFIELMTALNLRQEELTRLKTVRKLLTPGAFADDAQIVIDDVRDALCDISVFSTGAHHLMGIDGDRDMNSVVGGVMTRFIKDEADKEATIALHAAKGVTQVYFEGEYPTMIMKSSVDQPDAPQGKFLKSASYEEPVFYDPTVVDCGA